ncbi:MAG: class I SAM-dependent methyltransferase [bacterium]
MERREYVESRPSWEKEYGTYDSKLGFIGEQISLMLQYAALDSKSLRVLDFGCAYGMHLRFLKQLNPGLELYGVEVARQAAEAARRIVGEGNIFWQTCGDQVPLADCSLDVIFSFDMIEHISDHNGLKKMAAEMQRLLKPDGVAFVETPNYNRRMRWLHRLTGQGHMLKYDHCNLFDERRLRGLLEPKLNVRSVIHRGLFDPGLHVPLIRGIFSPKLYLSSHICAVCGKQAST